MQLVGTGTLLVFEGFVFALELLELGTFSLCGHFGRAYCVYMMERNGWDNWWRRPEMKGFSIRSMVETAINTAMGCRSPAFENDKVTAFAETEWVYGARRQWAELQHEQRSALLDRRGPAIISDRQKMTTFIEPWRPTEDGKGEEA